MAERYGPDTFIPVDALRGTDPAGLSPEQQVMRAIFQMLPLRLRESAEMRDALTKEGGLRGRDLDRARGEVRMTGPRQAEEDALEGRRHQNRPWWKKLLQP